MSLYVNIGGVQQRGLAGVSIARVSVTQSVSNRNTAEVTLIVTGGATTYSEGQQVDIGNDSTRYFVGTIAVLSSRWTNCRQATPIVEHTLSCVSLDQIASRRIVTIPQVYENKTAGYIVNDIATQFLGGENLDTSGVQAGPTFASFTVEAGASVYQVFDSIAERAGMLWDILGQIALPALRFYSRGSLVSGWSITASSPLVIGGGGGETGITVTTDRQGLANEIWVQVPEGPGDVTHQDFLGDGSDREFSVQHPIDSQPTITVDGIEKSVSLEGYIAAAWYYTPGSPTVRQDPTQPVLTSSNLLRVEYTPRVQVLLSAPSGAAHDAANIAARATLEATSGRYQAVIQAGDGATVANATAAAQAYLAAHVTPSKKITIRSFDSQAEALSIGQTIAVNLPALGVNSTFLVEAVTRSWEGKLSDGADAIMHTHSLSTGAVIGDWVTTFASAWSVGGGGTSAAGAVTSGGSSLTVQDLGTLAANVASITPLVSGATGDMLMVAWRFGATVYSVAWGAAWTGTDKADYRAKANSKHAYLFVYALDTWNLIAWRTDY